MNKLTISLATVAIAGVLVAGCGAEPDTKAAAAPTTTVTEATMTTAYVAPTTTTIDSVRAAMATWASAHSGDMTAVTDAINKVSTIAGQISTTAGNNIDNFTATNDADQLSAGANKVIALQEQEKRACLAVATAVKAAQKGLPVPLDTVNEPYSSALEHYLSASRSCQVGEISDATADITAANADVRATTAALKDYVG